MRRAHRLDANAGRTDALRALQDAGCEMDVYCLWISRSGHGGPILMPTQMAPLAELNLPLWFTVYAPHEDARG
jgi:hypothetical protein